MRSSPLKKRIPLTQGLLLDRHGHPAGALNLQVRPEGPGTDYVRLPGRFIDRGRGRDEDEASWQEVTMPPTPWWRKCGYDKRDHRDALLLPQTRDRAGVPFYVDTDSKARCAGQAFDYDEYHAERFAALVRDGAAVVREHRPAALIIRRSRTTK